MRHLAGAGLLILLSGVAAHAAPVPPTVGAPPRPAAPAGPVIAMPDTGITPSQPLIVPGKTPEMGVTSEQQRAQEYLSLGRTLDQQGQWIAAVSAYRNALRFDTTLVRVAYRIGEILAELGDDNAAIKMFSTEVARHPNDVEAARELGMALARAGRHEEAIRQLEYLTRRRPRDDTMWSALGFAYLAAGRAADAEAAIRRAIALPPARASEQRDLGVVLSAEHRTTEARTAYRRALAINPRDASVWVNLGNLERRENRPDSALAAYRRASAIDTALISALQGEAQVLVETGRAAEAGPVYLRWTRLNPADFGARLEAVQYFMAEGRPDIAVELARDAVRRSPRSGDARVLLGAALDANGLKRESLAELRTAEALYASEAGKQRAEHLIGQLRASAPDSLRALFAADSVAHARTPAPPR